MSKLLKMLYDDKNNLEHTMYMQLYLKKKSFFLSCYEEPLHGKDGKAKYNLKLDFIFRFQAYNYLTLS